MHSVVADPIGGPENLKYVEVPDPEPAAGEILVKLEAIGVNFIDVYFRTGLYKAPETPVRLGSEGAGIVVEPNGSTKFKRGDRVVYAMSRPSYAELAAVPERLLAHLPAEISFDDGAAVMLQGMTAHYLTRSTFPLQAGQICLVYAAAGGTGSLIVQLAKIAGARVIATASTEEKRELAKRAGADEVMSYGTDGFVSQVRRLTNGNGVDVVYDSVGRDTFSNSLDCLRPRGMMVTFGNSSGPVPAIEPLTLSAKGSLFLTRPNLGHHTATSDEVQWRAGELFSAIDSGKLRVNIFKSYALRDAAEAHRDLEARRSTGKLLLKP